LKNIKPENQSINGDRSLIYADAAQQGNAKCRKLLTVGIC
jgi:hypothetical protein